jgi:hypothetical protein
MRVPILFILATIAALILARADVLPYLNAHGQWEQRK